MPETAIVILNWNGKGFLERFLGKVAEFSAGANRTVYVADNGSEDGSCEWIEKNFSNIRVIRLGKNYGFAGGYNLALEQIDAKYFVLLNSDVEVTPGWLDPLIGYLQDHPDTASCQPKILSFSGRDHFEYAGAAGGFIDKYGYPFCRGRVLSSVEKDEGQYDTVADIFWSSGACMAVSADAWRKSTGFDPDFFAHMEEIDLCWRFHRMGFRVVFIPQSKVYHVGGGALPYNSPFKTYLNFRNSLYMLYKNLPEKHFSHKIFFRKVLDGIAAIFFLLKGEIKSMQAVVKAHRDVRRARLTLIEKRKHVRTMGTMEPEGLILNKSIIYGFYFRGSRTFTSM